MRQLRTTYDLRPALLISEMLPSLLYILIATVAYRAIIPPFRIGDKFMDYAAFLVPGVALMEVASISVLGGAMFWTDKYNGMLERILSMPFPRPYYFVSRILSLLVTSLGIAGVLTLVGLPFVFSSISTSLPSALLAIVSIACTCLFFGSLSLLATPSLKTPDSVTVFSRLVSTPLVLMSSVFYPLDNVPAVVRDIARFNPLSFAADILRFSLYGVSDTNIATEVAALVAATAFIFLITVYAFERLEFTNT